MRIFVLALLALFYCEFTPAAGPGEPGSDWAYVQKRLKQAKLPKAFIQDMREIYKPNDFMKVLELNILLFLRQTDYHTPQVSGDAVGEVRTFVNKNKKAFDSVEKEYGVSRETVSSLLYIETRHGANKGNFHVASVFLDLIQADRPTVVRYLKARLPHYTSNYDKAMQGKIAKRARLKADWALGEIKALSEMYKRDKKMLKSLKGSYSGAFGMAQFIPSSYVSMARSLKKGHTADIGKADDAIASVAHYLKVSGWRPKQNRSHKRALMRYNNSEDYAEAIMSLAKRASGEKIAQREVQAVGKKNKVSKKRKR